MAIDELPTVATFGGPKESLRSLAESAKRQSSANQNAVNEWLVKLATAIGLDDGTTASSLRAAILAITSGTVGTVQIVSTATATITTARHVIVTYAGGTCTLTLPDAAAARELTVWKANTSSNTIVLARSAGDTASGTINAVASSYTLTQGYYNDQEGARYDVVGQAALTWWVNSEWTAIAEARSYASTFAANISAALDAVGIGGIVVSTSSGTVTTEQDVYVTATDATVAITLPDAAEGRRIRIHKANDVATQTINLVRSAGDIGGGGTINASAGTRAIACTSLTSNERRRSWIVAGMAALTWTVDDGEHREMAQHETRISDLEAFDATSDGRLNALEAAGLGSQLITGTSGTITTAQDVYLTNAGATLTITLPDAAEGRRIRIHKANSATTQTITLVRSAGDAGGGGEINDTAASFDIVMTSIAGTRRSFSVSASAALEWHVDSGESTAIATLAGTVSTNTTDITSLKNGVVANQQIVSTSTATISAGTTHVYIDHAAARTDLTLPATSSRFSFTIMKRATSGGFGVRLIPASGSDAIQGLAAGTNFDIAWMTTNASSTTARPAAYVTSSASNVVDVA